MSTTIDDRAQTGSMREVLAIAAPMVISTGCDTVMIFTDRLLLAQLGPEHMNAAMAGGLTSFVTGTFFIGIIGFATALVAQHLGAGRRERCAIATAQAAIIALAAWPLLLCLRPAVHALFASSGVSPTQLALQTEFFDILNAFAGLMLLRGAFAGFFSGIGRTRVVMVSTITAMAVNIVANWLLIFGHAGLPAMGIRGSAWGSVIGSACGLVVLLAAYYAPAMRAAYGTARAWRFDRSEMATLLRFGFPGGIEMLLNLVAFNGIIMAFHARGPETATATTLMFNWDLVSFVPLIGLQIAVMSLVGRAMGARQPEVAERVVRSGLRLGWIYSGTVLIAFVGIPDLLVGVFRPGHPDPLFDAAAPLAATMIRIAAAYVLVEAVVTVVSGALRGAGDTVFTMWLSVGIHWLLLPVAVGGLHLLHLPPVVVWSTQVAAFMLCSGLFWLRWRSGKWRTIAVVAPVAAAAALDHDQDFHEPPDA
ncbi:MAG: MATE family efflux transporter [Planctomycetes bacterium]|nr:MATE family efflux transporter [Planctomycetota bacterium]